MVARDPVGEARRTVCGAIVPDDDFEALPLVRCVPFS